MEIGRIYVKTAGREAGARCVVVDDLDKNFVVVASPLVKRRRCNIRHLEPTSEKIDIKKGATAEQVEKALKKAKVSLEA